MKHIKNIIAAAALVYAGGATAQEAPIIGISYLDLSQPYVVALQKAAQSACKTLELNCVEADSTASPDAELRNVESMLQRGISCLALEATSLDASVASIKAANAKSIPVVQFNGRTGAGDYITFVGSAHTDAGNKLGIFIEDLYKKSGKDKLRGIYLRGIPGLVVDLQRDEGFKNHLQAAGLTDKVEFVEQYAQFDRATGQSVTESILTTDKAIDFIVANNDDMILGAMQAAKQFGLGDKVAMIGVDGLPEALEAIKSGALSATVFQDPEGQGGGGVWGCYLALKKVNLPKEILIPFSLVTKDNVDDFLAIASRVYIK